MSISVTQAVSVAPKPAPTRKRRIARFEIAYLGVFAVLFAALTTLFPRSGDDWAWGSSIGTSRLDDFFRGYNGRYAGDLFILFLMRATYLIPLFEAVTFALTIWLVLDLVGNRTKIGYAAAITLFMAMPLGDWRQTTVWVSGYSNYAPAALAAIVFLREAKADWLGTPRRVPAALRLAGVVVFAFVAALFMETVTIYLLLASLAYLIAHRVMRKRFSPDSVAWFLASVAGTVVMFSNSSYRLSLEGKGVHAKATAGFHAKVIKLFDPMAKYTVTSNWLLNVVLVAVICALVAAHRDRLRRRWAVLITCTAIGSLAMAFALLAAEHKTSLRPLWRCSAGVAGILLLVAVVTTACTILSDRFERVEVFVGVVSILLLIGPLIFVVPIGPRQFYITYVFFMALTLLMLRHVTPRLDPLLVQRLLPLVGFIAVAIFAWYFRIYGVVHEHADSRVQHLHTAVDEGKTAVVVHRLPYTSYVHNGDPRGRILQPRYKLYYHLPSDLKITVTRPGKHPSTSKTK